jgi:hypothetical protein
LEVLILSKKKAISDLSREIKPGDICYYLSDDYAALLKVRATLTDPSQVLLPGAIFHQSVEKIGANFLRLCHQITLKNNPEIYWGSQLASRNSATIPLLKYMAYYYCAKVFLANASSRVLFICDFHPLARLIHTESQDRGFSTHIRFSTLEAVDSFKSSLRLFLKGVYYLIFSIRMWFFTRFLKNERLHEAPPGERYLLRSWVTADCLDGEGRYKDRNFGVLPNYLREQGKDVWILPMFFNLNQREILSYMKALSVSGQKFLFPDQYLTIPDIIKTLMDGVKTVYLDLKGLEFDGRNMTGFFKSLNQSTSLSPALLSLNSVKYLIKKFSEKGIGIDRFVYPFENNPAEKTFLRAVRRYYPGSKIIGFQHTVWYKEQLGMYLHPLETGCHPLPDQIVCGGRRYPEILEMAGFPAQILCPGPNLRYTAVNRAFKPETFHESGQRSVLIILNFDFNQTMELLEKVGAALQTFKNVKIYIKAHPMSRMKELEEFLLNIRFPKYEWASGTVQQWLARVHAVFMTGGSVSNLETIVTGIPLLRVSLGSNFDFDPLWDEYPFSPLLSEPEEIADYLDKAFRMNLSARMKLLEFGRQIANSYFEPVTAETIKVFLN